MRRTLGSLGAVLIICSACGGEFEATIQGSAYLIALSDCDLVVEVMGDDLIDRVSNLQLTFRNESGDVVGTTRTGAGQQTEVPDDDDVCAVGAEYEIAVPRSEFYTVEAEDVEASEPISFEELESEGFEFDISLGTFP